MSGLREALEQLAGELEYDVAGAPGKIRAVLAAHPAEPTVTTTDGWILVGPAIPSVALEPELEITDLLVTAWTEVQLETIRSLRSRSAEHERIAALGGQSSERVRRKLAEIGHPTYAQQAIAERALAGQLETLPMPTLNQP